MLSNLQFSIPLWPGLSPTEIKRDVYPFLEECHDIISDLYFTCRIDPFNTDAMGGILVAGEDQFVTENSFIISESLGIPLSATFNNVNLFPSMQNYKTFCKNLRPLYDRGLRIATIPNTTWLRFGLKQEFPELFVKNTVLNKVRTASEGSNLYSDGFDYINLDRNLMRDQRSLKEFHAMKLRMEERLGRKLYISLLYNEMCENNCPIQDDHYNYNLQRTVKDPAFFSSEMFNIAPCKVKDENSALWVLKSASVPSYYSHLDHLSQYVDVLKMHGRESKHRFYETMALVRQFKRRELIQDPFRAILSKVPEEDRKRWLKIVQTCRFNCWECTECEDIAIIIDNRKKKDV